MLTVQGNPSQMGAGYGRAFADKIRRNIDILVAREGSEPLPRQETRFIEWVEQQSAAIAHKWPWLVEEMEAVADAVGVEYQEVLLLNLRAWQFEFYGPQPPLAACSSLAIELSDGTVACAGALDDPLEYYCGPVRYLPSEGYSLITFPITGTSWGNRGMNSVGLATGISSQILPGLRPLPGAINQDLALRIILQTCATVKDVREFCKAYPFTMNIVCVDAQGGAFCAQQTAAGLHELPAADSCALTNHVVSDELRARLAARGVTEFPESATTRPRLKKLQDFAAARGGKCTAEEVKQLVGNRDDSDPGTIHNEGSIYITYSDPQADSHTLWILQPQTRPGHSCRAPEVNAQFEAYAVCDD